MMSFGTCSKEDIPQLKALWKIVFDEEPRFLEQFFSWRIQPKAIFAAKEGKKIVSALHALETTYHKKGIHYPVSYIVGAATAVEYRQRGLMGTLLGLVKAHYSHPITLFPAVRPFYEKHGYITTSSTYMYPLKKNTEIQVHSSSLTSEHLNAIYMEATKSCGALDRDAIAWQFLTDGYETVSVSGAYAFIHQNKAVEAMAVDASSALLLVHLLQQKGIESIQVLSDSPFALTGGTPVPMGMATDASLQGLYIAEQY